MGGELSCTSYILLFTMHYSLVQSTVLRLHVVRPSDCLFVCDVGGYGAHGSEILETNCMDNPFALRSSKAIPSMPRGAWEHFGETRGGVGKSGMLEHKSGNISETRKDRGKVTMDGL